MVINGTLKKIGWVILGLLIVGILSALIIKNSAIEEMTSAKISEPLKIALDGLSNSELDNIRVDITSFSGIEKAISRNHSTNQWTKDGHWIKDIKFTIPSKEFDKLKEIEIKIGNSEFVYNRSQILVLWKVNVTNGASQLVPPDEVRSKNSIVPPLNKIINWPGDFILVKTSVIDSLSFIIIILILIIIFRENIKKLICLVFNKRYIKEKAIKLFHILKTQILVIILVLIVAIIFYPPGQGNRGSITGLTTLLSYGYYTLLNFFSIYNKNNFLDILQFIIFLVLVAIGLGVCFKGRIQKLEQNDIPGGKTKNPGKWMWRLSIGIILILTCMSLIIHLNNRNNHFQEADSTIVYPALYDFPKFAYQFSSDFYSPKPGLKILKDGYIGAVSNLSLPHALKSFFALPFGTTYTAGVGLVYGLVTNASSSYEQFMSNSLIVTILIFHLSIVLLFFILKRSGIKSLAALIVSMLFMFSISLYSYSYSLYGANWNIFSGLLWLAILLISFENKHRTWIISLATGILVFFNYLIVFYWASFIYLELFSAGLKKTKFVKKFCLVYLGLFLIAVVIGVLGFAPARHILFLAPSMFVILAYGLDGIFSKIDRKTTYIVGIIIILLIISTGMFSLMDNLKSTSEKISSIPIDRDITQIIIQDSSYEMFYRNWDINSTDMVVQFADPALFKSGEVYNYLSQTMPFDSAFSGWQDYKNIRVDKLKEYINVSNLYFIAYNPNPNKFKHTRPNNIFYTKFKVISLN